VLTIICGFSGAFILGAKAATDWRISVESDANAKIGAAGYNKMQELKNVSIDSAMIVKVEPLVSVKEQEAEVALQEYFNSKLDSLMTSEEVVNMENKFENIKTDVVNRYMAEIDALFK